VWAAALALLGLLSVAYQKASDAVMVVVVVVMILRLGGGDDNDGHVFFFFGQQVGAAQAISIITLAMDPTERSFWCLAERQLLCNPSKLL